MPHHPCGQPRGDRRDEGQQRRTLVSAARAEERDGKIFGPCRDLDFQVPLGGYRKRTVGIGDLYQGSLARRMEEMSPRIGGPVTVAHLRTALPKLVAPLIVRSGRDMAAFLPPPADGGFIGATLLGSKTPHAAAAPAAPAQEEDEKAEK